MPLLNSDSARQRYIISATDPQQLADFLNSAEPGVEVVDQIGPADQPHTVIVSIPPEHAPSLQRRVRSSPQLTIEPDRPLSLFGDGDGA